jgi:hypothetical protein
MDANDFLKSISQQVAPQTPQAPTPVPQAVSYGTSNYCSSGPKLQFSVPCFEVEYEEQRAPSLKYIFFDLPFPSIPQKLSFHVVNGWIGGTRTIHQMIKILRPDGTVHLETPKQPLEFVDVNTPFLAVNFFPKIPFDAEGHFFIVVHLEDQEVLRYPLTVRTAGESPRSEEPSSPAAQAPTSPSFTPPPGPFGGGFQGSGSSLGDGSHGGFSPHGI